MMTKEQMLALAKKCGASIFEQVRGGIAFTPDQLLAYTSAIEEKYQASIAMLRERDKYYGAPCEYFDEHTKTWIPARFIALAFSKVDREPLVQAEKRMPIFGTWNSIRGLDEKGIKAAYALFEQSLSATQASADAFIAEVKARAIQEEREIWTDIGWKVVGSFGQARGKHVAKLREMLDAAELRNQQEGKE